MIKKRITISGLIVVFYIFLSANVLAQTTEQPEIIDEDSTVLACIEGGDFDAMTETEQDKVDLPICDEVITTEELATEMNGEITYLDNELNNEECLTIVDYDVMTDNERAALDMPVCDEAYNEDPLDPNKT